MVTPVTMLLQVIVGAILGLVLFVGVVVLVLKRAPVLFVADKLPGSLYGRAEGGADVVDGEGGRSERGASRDSQRRSADEADVIDRPGGGGESP
jgi:hypothetical protein